MSTITAEPRIIPNPAPPMLMESVYWTVPFSPQGAPAFPAVSVEMHVIADRLRVAVAKLNEFEDPDMLAAFLTNLGVKGRPQDSSGCALAVWLKKAIDYEPVTVGNAIGIHFPGGVVGVMRTPPVLAEFFRRFDRGAYPGLFA